MLGQRDGENLLADCWPNVALRACDEGLIPGLQINVRLRPQPLDGLDRRRDDN